MGFNLDAFLTVPEHDSLNHAGLPGVGGGGGGTIFSVNEIAHGFEPGQPIYFDGATSGWNLASASSDTTTADALVFDVTDDDNFEYILAGELELTSDEWDVVVGATEGGLITGEHYRLSITTGRLALKKQTGEITQFVMRALSVTKALVYLGEPHAGLGVGLPVAFEETQPASMATYVLTGSYTAIPGASISLPAAGRYHVAYHARSDVSVENSHNYFRLYNSTLAAEIPNTEGNAGFDTPIGAIQNTTSNEAFITVNGPTTLILQGQHAGLGVGRALSDAFGRTTIAAASRDLIGGFGVNLQNAGAPLAGGPFGALDLLDGLVAADAGGGKATITPPVPPAETFTSGVHSGTDHSGITGSGITVQQIRSILNGGSAGLPTIIPHDSSIPQITEGTQVLTAAITPTSMSNILLIEFNGSGIGPPAGAAITALFRDSIVNALAATASVSNNGNTLFLLRFYLTVPSLSAQTYRIRAGYNNGAGTINAPTFGGVCTSVLTVTELTP